MLQRENITTGYEWDWKEAYLSWERHNASLQASNSSKPIQNTVDLSKTATITRELFEELEKENPQAMMDFFKRGGRIADNITPKTVIPDTTKKTMTRAEFEILEKESPLEAMNYCLQGGTLEG